jgi:hypothetical protein
MATGEGTAEGTSTDSGDEAVMLLSESLCGLQATSNNVLAQNKPLYTCFVFGFMAVSFYYLACSVSTIGLASLAVNDHSVTQA